MSPIPVLFSPKRDQSKLKLNSISLHIVLGVFLFGVLLEFFNDSYCTVV